MAIEIPKETLRFNAQDSCEWCFGTVSAHDKDCDVEEYMESVGSSPNYDEEIKKWGYSPSAVDGLIGKKRVRGIKEIEKTNKEKSEWASCNHCHEIVYRNEEHIQISRFKRVGSTAKSLNYHLDCWIEMAGSKFVPQ